MTDGDKKEIRREMKQRFASVTRGELADGGRELLRLLGDWEPLQVREGLLGFSPFGGEVDTGPFNQHWLNLGKPLFLTRVGDDGIALEVREIRTLSAVRPGYKDIPEPDPAVCRLARPSEIDVVLVPGLAFDLKGTRLGRGKGHYDRLLARLPREVLRMGIAWDWQVFRGEDCLPREEHDAVMDYLCTPTTLMRCEPGRRDGQV